MAAKLVRLGIIVCSVVAVGAAVLATGVAAPVLTPLVNGDPAPSILAHRAYYKMELESARNGSSVRGASGAMSFSWQDACEGWAVEQHLDMTFTHEDSDESHLVSAYSTWESKDGKRYRFNYRRTNDDQPEMTLRGSAALDGADGSGKAVYTAPVAKEIDLPAGSYFPTAHTLALIRAAIAHKAMMSAAVFDGTDEEGLSEISAVIGASKPLVSTVAKEGLDEGLPLHAWPIRMAFFPIKDEQPEPDYEMDTNMLPNGVSEFMVIDYGDFKLRGTLEKIELLPKPDC